MDRYNDRQLQEELHKSRHFKGTKNGGDRSKK
jgi:hypothetical protein